MLPTLRHLRKTESRIARTPVPLRNGPQKRSFHLRGVPTTPASSPADIRRFFDECAATGFSEPHGHPEGLLAYRLGLIREHARIRSTDVVLDLGCGNGHHLMGLAPDIGRGIGIDLSPGMIGLARARLKNSRWDSRLAFKVDDSECLNEIESRSIDVAICVGAFEHMLDKRAVLASVYRVLAPSGRFFCLAADGAHLWYRTIAPLLGHSTRHLSSDRFLDRNAFVGLLDAEGFCQVRCGAWTFIPKGDMPALVGVLLSGLAAIGRCGGVDSLRGGFWVSATKS